MFKNDYALLEEINIESDAIIINQCDRNEKKILKYRDFEVIWIDTTERGLSNSRNMALKNATADICILCDDDEKLAVGYPDLVKKAYRTLPEADVIVFNVNRIGWNEKEKTFIKHSKIRAFKTFSSVHLTFRREKIIKNSIFFDKRFGTGSGMYSCAEDAIFCIDCHKRKLRMYKFPGILCDVNCENSSWFDGYNEKYFYDVGAFLSAAFPFLKYFLKWYYPFRCRNISNLNAFMIVAAINKGFKGFEKGLNFEKYKEIFNED